MRVLHCSRLKLQDWKMAGKKVRDHILPKFSDLNGRLFLWPSILCFVTFTNHFKYLGIFVSYNLHSDYDTDRRISSASSSMGALNHFWVDTSVDLCSKCLIFPVIDINLLLWGCESWDLCVSPLDKLEVFLHRSIRRILGIAMTQLKEDIITNEMIRRRFFDIPMI